MLTRHYIFSSALFLLTPPLGAGLLIWTAHKLSVDTQAALFSNILWPTIGAVFLAALIGWTVFLRRPTKLSDGKKAGVFTIFLCYLLGLIPLAVEAGSWDGLWGVVRIYLALFALVQIASFWLAYPIGALFGRWIAKRMLYSTLP
jgi:hypothetical protein